MVQVVADYSDLFKCTKDVALSRKSRCMPMHRRGRQSDVRIPLPEIPWSDHQLIRTGLGVAIDFGDSRLCLVVLTYRQGTTSPHTMHTKEQIMTLLKKVSLCERFSMFTF